MRIGDEVMTPYGKGAVEGFEAASLVPAGERSKVLVRFDHLVYGGANNRTPKDFTDWFDRAVVHVLEE